jgi:glutathione S-transferase
VALYNHQLPQSALKSKTPMQAMKEWYASHPHLFQKRPYDRPGCDTYETLLAADTRRAGFSFGNSPTIADVYLIPQIESARRFKVDMGRWPLIMEVDAQCGALEAFQRAVPMAQPDAA